MNTLHDSFTINIHGEQANISPALIEKYNQPGPRYTSYPTAPEWNDSFGANEFIQAIAATNTKGAPLSLYFHLPFCQSLCLFCGCNTVITKKREVTMPYLAHLKQEIALVSAKVDRARPVQQLHWGGGTPTYLTPEEMRDLLTSIREHFTFAPDAEIGIEVDPRATTSEHCRTLAELGFNRISMGIQDFNPLVQ
ncbi:MAG TPA: radical SAM protein, partial [Blastocatellia bacterium]|nr:radical SAM protein [Blastocatellia bacterium]